MPTYEYECKKGHVTESFRAPCNRDWPTACAECGRGAKRIISAGAGIIFKGSGFYATDYAKGGR